MAAPFELPESIPLDGQVGSTVARLVELMQRLLAPDGCPWDREQDLQSLRRYVVEEAAEVVDAIDSGRPEELKEELGDLLLQIVFQAELARKQGWFGPDDVVLGICEKLVRRHPHVFSDLTVDDADEVVLNWERIKAKEKADRGLIDGIPRNLPALSRAYKTSSKVAAVGFDWPDAESAQKKVQEELQELQEVIDSAEPEPGRLNEEYGDLLFALVSWGRHLGLEPEESLRGACDKFHSRFSEVERAVVKRHGGWPRDERGKPAAGLSLDELEEYWNQAKEASS